MTNSFGLVNLLNIIAFCYFDKSIMLWFTYALRKIFIGTFYTKLSLVTLTKQAEGLMLVVASQVSIMPSCPDRSTCFQPLTMTRVLAWIVRGLCFCIQKHMALLHDSCETNMCRHLRLENTVPQILPIYITARVLCFGCHSHQNIQIIKYISINLPEISRVNYF